MGRIRNSVENLHTLYTSILSNIEILLLCAHIILIKVVPENIAKAGIDKL